LPSDVELGDQVANDDRIPGFPTQSNVPNMSVPGLPLPAAKSRTIHVSLRITCRSIRDGTPREVDAVLAAGEAVVSHRLLRAPVVRASRMASPAGATGRMMPIPHNRAGIGVRDYPIPSGWAGVARVVLRERRTLADFCQRNWRAGGPVGDGTDEAATASPDALTAITARTDSGKDRPCSRRSATSSSSSARLQGRRGQRETGSRETGSDPKGDVVKGRRGQT
jgi:hypothetical protein